MKTQLDNWNEGATRGIDKFIEYEGTHAYPTEGVVAFLGNENLKDVLIWKGKEKARIYERKGTKKLPIGPFKLIYPFKRQKTIPVVAINYLLSYIGLCELMIIDNINFQDLVNHISLRGNMINSFFPLSNPTPKAMKVIENYDVVENYLSRGTSSVTDQIVEAINCLELPSFDFGLLREEAALKEIKGAYQTTNLRNILNVYLNVGTCGFVGHPIEVESLETLKSLKEIDINSISLVRSKVIDHIKEGMKDSYPLFPIQGITNMNVFCFSCLDYLPPPDPLLLAMSMGTTLLGTMVALEIYASDETRINLYFIYLLQTVKAAMKSNVMPNVSANVSDYVVGTPAHWWNLMGYGAPYLNIMSKEGYAIIAVMRVEDTVTFASPLVEIVNSSTNTTSLEVDSKLPNMDRLFTKVNLTFTDELLMIDSFVGVKCIFDNIEEEESTGKLTAKRIYPAIYLLSFMGSSNEAGESFCEQTEMTEEDGRLGVTLKPMEENKWKAPVNIVNLIGTHARLTIDDTYELYEDIESPYFFSKCFMEMKENPQYTLYLKEGNIPDNCPLKGETIIPTSISVGIDPIAQVWNNVIKELINEINTVKRTSELCIGDLYYLDIPFVVNVLVDENGDAINHIGITKSVNILNEYNCNSILMSDYRGRYTLFQRYANGTYKQMLFVYVVKVSIQLTVNSVDLITLNGTPFLNLSFNYINIAEEFNPYKFLTKGIEVKVNLKDGTNNNYLLRPNYEFLLNPSSLSLIGWKEYEGLLCFPKCYYDKNKIYTYHSNGVIMFEVDEYMRLIRIAEQSWIEILGHVFNPSVVGNFEEFVKMIGGVLV